jgi:SAM-dependent methyltransferase
MLTLAHTANSSDFVQGDAFTLPFADESFNAVVALRLIFHFAQLEPLLSEMRRVVKPGGTLVFDTYLWSPRALLPLDQRRWGSGIYIHPPRVVKQSAQRLGMSVVAWKPCFLFSPYLYRRLPIQMVRLLEHGESYSPSQWRARAFWQITRAV